MAKRGGNRGTGDKMLNYGRALELEPVRVVVELHQDDFARLNQVSSEARLAPSDLLRVIALQLARS